VQRTPEEEIRQVRFKMVQRLLLDTNNTLATIADKTGFSSGASLSQLYRQHPGETPGSFRNSRSSTGP
jgi:transcriptional regulator GlxA family with amidase domain